MQKFDAVLFLKTATNKAGVYRMYNGNDEIIYVGKAKNLKKRLSSYFKKNLTNEKTKALVSHVAKIDLTITHTETEALILEHNYIKQYLPKYNVLLRDDKSYPYILLSEHMHPRLAFHRGAKKRRGEYFGPYPESGAIKETLHLLQKIFPIRQCEDTVYANRSRPCLMYQIKRCCAPCVANNITDEHYQHLVEMVKLFLQGKDQQVLELLIAKMEAASEQLHFEEAVKYRDQIQAIRRVQEQQSVVQNSDTDLDVLGFATEKGVACIHLLMVRHGKVLGSRSYFPKIPANTSPQEIFESFLTQYYLASNVDHMIPSSIIVNADLAAELDSLTNALTEVTDHKVQFIIAPRGIRGRYLKLANTNALTALNSKINHQLTTTQRFEELERILGIKEIKRMECFDISHTMGENTVASCVVFNRSGAFKQDYRRYNIEGITGGDDYAAMEQVLKKRYSKQISQEKLPDIIFIDGGRGQLNRAYEVISQYWDNWIKKPLLIGIAKGVTRKHGNEELLMIDGSQLDLPNDSSALHLIWHIRDESHNYAINSHRTKRDKARKVSVLEEIAGIGAKRRQALLKYLGGMQELKRASVEDIAKIPGISITLAENIYNALR